MTDPTAKANFAKYGNPQGYGHFHVSIALPKAVQ
jgi:preprotein translocase subunit Sec63